MMGREIKSRLDPERRRRKSGKWNIFSESLFHFLERFCWGASTCASPLTLCLCRLFDVPPLAAFAETNLQSSLSSQLPLDPASHASTALPSPNKPLMRPNLPALFSCPFSKLLHLKTHDRPVFLTQTTCGPHIWHSGFSRWVSIVPKILQNLNIAIKNGNGNT